MPKTKLARPKRDYILELIIGRKCGLKMPDEEFAQKMKMSPSTMYRRLNSESDSWSLGEIKRACKILDIPIEELRANIRA